MKAYFSSRLSKDGLTHIVLNMLGNAHARSQGNRVDLHIMAFAFTDTSIRDKIIEITADNPSLQVRIIADWSQGSRSVGRVLPSLIELNRTNLKVRFKYDEPYIWDCSARLFRWSYSASIGLLHTRALSVLIEDRPFNMLTGSMNWTKKSRSHYENLIEFDAMDAGSFQIMTRFDLEFRTMWNDERLTLSPEGCRNLYRSFAKQSTEHPIRPVGYADHMPIKSHPDSLRELLLELPSCDTYQVAFNAKLPFQDGCSNGYCCKNRDQSFNVRKRGGKLREMKTTILSLSLDTINGASPGDTLCVAMYALSRRVPEYSALLQAARKGIKVELLLDHNIGHETVNRLNELAQSERLPLRATSSRRRMHQKYLVHVESSTVVFGTANMTSDAYDRHSEYRVRITGDKSFANEFLEDFANIRLRCGEVNNFVRRPSKHNTRIIWVIQLLKQASYNLRHVFGIR